MSARVLKVRASRTSRREAGVRGFAMRISKQIMKGAWNMCKRKVVWGLVLAAVVFYGIQTGNACTPPPVVDLTAAPNETVTGVTMVFDGNSSYAQGGKTIVKYEWDWTNDGVYDYNEVPPCDGIATHAYTSADTYTAKLRVTDNRGLTAVDTCTVHISLKVWYVDVNAMGNNDGSLWGNAFTDLQDALAAADCNDEVWVAEGVYKPGTSRSSTFSITTDIGIYGGFSGIETARSQRDFNYNETILSGEIGTIYDSDNSYHVVTTWPFATATIDGFTVQCGNANGTNWPDSYGGGILCRSAVNISNCIIGYNKGRYGAGVCAGAECSNSPAAITNCIFIDNWTTDFNDGKGGGLFNESDSTITNCAFLVNDADKGGGVYNDSNAYDENGSSPNFINCTFALNDASSGSGMENVKSSPTITNCIVCCNLTYGYNDNRQIKNYWDANTTISYCDIQDSNGSGLNWDDTLGVDGGGNIDADPVFLEIDHPTGYDGIWRTADDGFRLATYNPPWTWSSSPCIDSADGNSAPLTDIAGCGRVDVNDIANTGTGDPNYVDMGAYEYNDD